MHGGFGSGTHGGFGGGGMHFGGCRFAGGGFRGCMIGSYVRSQIVEIFTRSPPIRSLISPNGHLITTSVSAGVWLTK